VRQRLKRLAVVFEIELRLKIVVELNQREMSPKQFREEFGGGSLSRVSRNFDRLAETGWLRLMRSEGPGGSRRGGVEHFYRATEMAFFDRETWAALPYSVRVTFSWNLFGFIASHLRRGVEAKMIGRRSGSGLSSQTLLVDEIGADRIIEAFANVFVSIHEEQDDAKLRVSPAGEELVRVSALQLAYEAPGPGATAAPSGRLVEITDPMPPTLVRASRILREMTCLDIIHEATDQAVSATEFHREFGGNVDKIRRLFKKTAENGWLKEVDWRTGGRRRGGTEKFYRATRPMFANADELLAGLPKALRQTDAGEASERICVDFIEAMEAETVDARDDRFVALSLVQLDQEGWEKVSAFLRDLWAFIRQEEREAGKRLEKSGEQPVAMTVALGLYETARSATKEP
jgi:hypothetical protein